jgi:hypothetical protein
LTHHLLGEAKKLKKKEFLRGYLFIFSICGAIQQPFLGEYFLIHQKKIKKTTFKIIVDGFFS